MKPYKPGQGVRARIVAASAAVLLALFAAHKLFVSLLTETTFTVLGMNVPHSAIWAALLFLALAAVIFWLTSGVETGVQTLDSKAHAVVDMLVDVEMELNKVSWPSSEELTRSTSAVLFFVVSVGAFLFFVGIAISFVMSQLGVLPA